MEMLYRFLFAAVFISVYFASYEAVDADLRLPEYASFPAATAEKFIRALNLHPKDPFPEPFSASANASTASIVERPLRFPGLYRRGSVDDLGHRAGYYRLPHTYDARMFYFFFESRQSKKDPIVIWLTGGPGCSSELAIFYENGPFKIADNMSLVWNEFGWDMILLLSMMKFKEDLKSAKPEKFSCLYFKRWQNQMKFWLTTLGLYGVIDPANTISTSLSNLEIYYSSPSSNSDLSKSSIDLDYHCKHRILSALDDKLYDIYFESPTAKDLWNALDSEYSLDDAALERFSSSAFNRFSMSDNKPLNEQIHEFQDHIRYLQSKGTSFSEDFKVACLIDKLPPSWSDFARELRHNQGDQTLVQAITRVRIECEHRLKSTSQSDLNHYVNLTEDPTKPNNHHFKPKPKFFKKKKPFNKSTKFQKKPFHQKFGNKPDQGNKKFCYVCGRTNHLAPSCFYKKSEPYKGPSKESSGPRPVVNMIEGISSKDTFRSQVEEV